MRGFFISRSNGLVTTSGTLCARFLKSPTQKSVYLVTTFAKRELPGSTNIRYVIRQASGKTRSDNILVLFVNINSTFFIGLLDATLSICKTRLQAPVATGLELTTDNTGAATILNLQFAMSQSPLNMAFLPAVI